MRRLIKTSLASVLALAVLFTLHTSLSISTQSLKSEQGVRFDSNFKVKKNKMPREARKKARAEYENELMRDPKTGRIPRNIRQQELAWKRESQVFKSTSDFFTWEQAGPNQVGGRTRGFAVDKANSSVLISAGVSGGIWKSTNKGLGWTLKTPDFQNMNVTYLAQDPRDTFTNNWYAVTGEFDGNSAGSPASGFRGFGIFKSEDNGETWFLLENAKNPNITRWDSEFDYMSRVGVNPINGDVFVASNAGVLLRSQNGGDTWSTVLGEDGSFQYVDFVISTSGKIIANLAADGNDSSNADPNAGFYVSDNSGESWASLSVPGYPSTYYRTVMELAPSNQNTMYVLSLGSGSNHHFFKVDLASGIVEDRSANLPAFGGSTGDFDTQGGYDMVVTVKPNDENFVVIGGTNLFRSTNGFATRLVAGATPTQTERTRHWIGGYTNTNASYALYNNHHPDQHLLVFDPSSANAAYSLHDGGISYTSNITSTTVSWTKRNTGYFVTQFYHAAISRFSDSKQIVGGTQDNGSPFFTVGSGTSSDASSGDGAYAYFGSTKMYVSYQNGNVLRYDIIENQFTYFDAINPASATGQLFIHPYEVDRNDEKIVYYPSSGGLFRTIDGGENGAASWTNLRTSLRTRSGLTITALRSSITPANVLYFGGTDRSQSPSLKPHIYRVDNANIANSAPLELTLDAATPGSYVSDIAVNPLDANEVLVTLSNYNVESVFYSSDGQNFVPVEGNLSGDATNPGPSVRTAAIATINNQKVYLVGTTTGVYATRELNGANTVWVAEGTSVVGNSLVNTLSYRESDQNIVAATHGRGAFWGTPNPTVSNEETADLGIKTFKLNQNYPNPFNPSTTLSYSLPTRGTVQISLFDITGRKIADLATESKPAGTHTFLFDGSRLASGTYLYQVKVDTENGQQFTQTKKMTLIK